MRSIAVYRNGRDRTAACRLRARLRELEDVIIPEANKRFRHARETVQGAEHDLVLVRAFARANIGNVALGSEIVGIASRRAASIQQECSRCFEAQNSACRQKLKLEAELKALQILPDPQLPIAVTDRMAV